MVIEHFISLGSRCHTSSFLKRNKLKKESYPFDWIYSNIYMIIHCLDTKFTFFLNKDYYSITDLNNYNQTHLYYYPDNNTMFNHHNPLNDKDYDYFKRCIERFYNVLKSNKKKLFIIMLDHNDTNPYYTYNDLIKYNNNEFDLLNYKLSLFTDNYEILIIIHKKNDNNNHHFINNNNLTILFFSTYSYSNGVSFIDDNDNIILDNIIKKYYNIESFPDTPSSNELN